MGVLSLLSKAWTIARLLPRALADSGERQRWERALPKSAVQLWGGDPDSVVFLAIAKHAVFSFQSGARELVLKVAVLSDRSEESINAEVEWVEYLAAAGLPVCRAVPSVHGRYVERIPIRKRGQLIAFVVQKAPGSAVDPAQVLGWPPELVEQWGAIVGRIHAASKLFSPSPQYERREMISEDTLAVARNVLGRKRPEIVVQLTAVANAISQLPRNRDWFGMVHGDMTPVNIFRDNGRLTLFDFETSSYSWFTYDLASPVYSLLVHGNLTKDASVPERTAAFFRSFMAGYVRENVLPIELIGCLPAFLSFLSLLNVALFYHQKIEKRAKKILAAVLAVSQDQDLQRQIDFVAIYGESLQGLAGRKN